MQSGEQIPSDAAPLELPRRLCNEIQLFDLCDREKCAFKDGRFCTDPEMLTRFEAVAEPEERPTHRTHDDDDEEDDELYPEEREEDDDEYSVFDDEDRMEQDEEW